MTVDAAPAFPSPRRRAGARKRRRLMLLALVAIVLCAATALILNAFRDTLVFFRTPSEIAERDAAPGVRLRLGGLVKAGSVVHDGATTRFVVTDLKKELPATYTGLLPDLFREGQGVVAEGALGPDGVFQADAVLAKHDENYMPKEVADKLKAQGEWRPDGAAQGAKAP